MYRIIGVIDGKVKLIKYDYANSNLLGTDGDYYGETTPDTNYYKGSLSTINTYYWNYKAANNGTNTWSTSLLNKTNLNTNYLNNIGTTWSKKIATTTWKVGGNTWSNIGSAVPSVAYQNEIVNPQPGQYSTTGETEYQAKIGLMYISDYGFAASPSAWPKEMYKYWQEDIRSNNWMYMGLYEWTISRNADGSNSAFSVFNTGDVHSNYVGRLAFALRPVFYLTSSVNYASGSGSATDPISIN